MGGPDYRKQVWKLNIYNSSFIRMPDLQIVSDFHGCGIHKPSDGSHPYILSAGPDGTEIYSLDGTWQAVRSKRHDNWYKPRIVSLGDKTYAIGTDKGKNVEVWNGQSWDLAQTFLTKRYYSGVMAVPKDFVY